MTITATAPTASRQPWRRLMTALTLGTLLATAGRTGNINHDGDFEGIGKMNPTVYNESTGEWQTLTTRNSYDPESFVFGGPGWTAIQSDYDGDGRADIAVYNRSTGMWKISFSSTGYQAPVDFKFGGAGWVVVTGDYDGDNIADPTIYREATGEWIIALSSLYHAPIYGNLGGPEHTAVPGDYDGDGASDPATYRRSDGLWTVLLSAHGYVGARCYVNTMSDARLVPSPADYDGDRKTDPAVFAYGCGNSYGKEYVFCWYVTCSSVNYQQGAPFRQLGREDCQPSNADPAPGDYDGDGMADFGVSWPDNTAGGWRMWKSSRGYNSHSDAGWNGTGFRPVQR